MIVSSEIVTIGGDHVVLLPQEVLEAAGISGPVLVTREGSRIIITQDAERSDPQG